MPAKFPDRKRKKIIADYLETENLSATARANHCDPSTVKRIVESSKDFKVLAKKKQEENTADMIDYMEKQKGTVFEIIGKSLKILNDEEYLRKARPNQLGTMVGILVDKWTTISGMKTDDVEEDGLSESLRKLAEELTSDDQQ